MPLDYGWLDRFRVGSFYPVLFSRFADVPRTERAGIKVLDVPSGGGVLTVPLAAAGFDVTACDLFPEDFTNTMDGARGETAGQFFANRWKGPLNASVRARLWGDGGDPPVPEGLACVPGDLEARLPFDDGAFDWVVSLEGIEHLPDRHHALRELRRVTKPGGTLILSTPNLLSVRARLATALVGQRTFNTWFDEEIGVAGQSEDKTRTYHGHAFLADYFELRYSLVRCGFKIRRLLPSNQSWTSLALYPLLFPAIAFATWRASRRGTRSLERQKRAGKTQQDVTPPAKEMLRHLLSWTLLMNKVIVLEAEAV